MHTAHPPVPSFDAIVVGARAAGAATAHLLARHGLHVLLLDRSRYGADTLSTHALMRGGVMQLSRWGLLDRIIAAGTPPVRRTTFRYTDNVVPVEVKPAHGVDALYAPRRTILDPILVDAAVDAGVDMRFGISVTDVVRDRSGAVTGVLARTASGDAYQARARIVIGADGLRSTIADLVGATYERQGSSANAVIYGYWSDVQQDGYEWVFRPGAGSGVIPTNDGQSCVFVGAPPARIGRGGPEVFRAILAESSADLAARVAHARPASGLRTFAGRRGHVRRSWGPGWALVGDAGYFKDPLSAHGLTDAFRDAELLALAVVAELVDGEQGALARYQARRDELSRALFDVTDTIAGHGWTDDEIPGLLLQLSASMADEVDALATLPSLPPASLARGPLMRLVEGAAAVGGAS